MLSTTLERVRQHWKNEEVFVANPLDVSQLDERLDALGIKATDEIIAVLSTLNEFARDQMDWENFGFWPIDQMIEENRKQDWLKDKSFVHFADLLIFSHTYAFKQNETLFASIYCQYASDHIVKVADSFEEFFEYYLNNNPKLWPE